jgi:ABC-2 type transport system permease protein
MLNLIRLYIKIGLLNELQYRANFFIQLFQSSLSLAISLAGILVIYSHTETVNGWSSADLLIVVGIFFIIGGVMGFIIQPSMYRLMEDIRKGTLDFVLVRPADSQLQVSLRQVQLWKLVDILMGVIVVGVGLIRAGQQPSLGQLAAFGVMLLAGLGITYSFWFAMATISIWLVRLEDLLHVIENLTEAGRWPVRIYPAWLQFGLTFLLPIAFSITVPAEALTGRLTALVALQTVILAVAMLVGSRWFWQFAIRHYSGASA